MKKIYAFNTFDENRDFNKAKLTQQGDNYVISASYGSTTATYTISPDMFKPQSKFIGFLTVDGDFKVVDDWKFNSAQEGKTGYLAHYRAVGDITFNVYFHDSYEESVLFINYPIQTELDVEITGGAWVHDKIAETIPAYNNGYLRKVKAKREVLTSLNPIDSIVALEQQVDLLTKIVKGQIDGSVPSWSNDYFSKVEGKTCIANENKAVTQLEEHKTKVREAQTKYFNDR